MVIFSVFSACKFKLFSKALKLQFPLIIILSDQWEKTHEFTCPGNKIYSNPNNSWLVENT
jgi:hypothetical protein